MGTPTSAQTGGIVSSFTGGAIQGLSQWHGCQTNWVVGRPFSSVLAFLFSAVLLQGGARNIPMMIAGRFIAGIAVGLLSAVVPMYCVSYSPKHLGASLT